MDVISAEAGNGREEDEMKRSMARIWNVLLLVADVLMRELFGIGKLTKTATRMYRRYFPCNQLIVTVYVCLSQPCRLSTTGKMFRCPRASPVGECQKLCLGRLLVRQKTRDRKVENEKRRIKELTKKFSGP